ncbi:MAG TPA: pseudouridine synthase [Thermoanaerobaculia bacterium]
MALERLQKILSEAGLASRREAEEWIREGRVIVNGKIAAIGERADAARDAIRVDGKRVRPPAARTYVLLNKPKGVVTTTSDPEGRNTVLEYLPAPLRRRVRPVGRLDVQTEGLLLLTDDGDLAARVSHPRSGCGKEYAVKVAGVPSDADLERLRRGIFLDGMRLRPCRIERVSTTGGRGKGNSWLRVTLFEGRSRQIRRMFQTAGHLVSKLKRTAIGPLRDGRLPPGAWRTLTQAEVSALERSLAKRPEPAAAGRRPR